MRRFMRYAYNEWCWAIGDFIWLAKVKPEVLRLKYDYWRSKYAA